MSRRTDLARRSIVMRIGSTAPSPRGLGVTRVINLSKTPRQTAADRLELLQTDIAGQGHKTGPEALPAQTPGCRPGRLWAVS